MAHENLVTVAEQSGFRHTGRTDEVERLCAAFAKTWPDSVKLLEYGTSAEGRRMLALVVSHGDPRKLPMLMLQGGIHPGESDGKDAGFIALREMLSEPAKSALLERVSILFVPAFNVDGHERFGRWNRPNQIGPEEMGWRTTAQNLNLNRDYTKADAPEMQAMLKLINTWEPLVCADLHVTDGADFEPDISLQVEPINQGDPALFASGKMMRDELCAKLAAQGSLPLPFYPDLASTDDPASGFQLTVYSPRFSTGYFAMRNRYTVLVETHSWKGYATRVRVTRNTIVGLTELVAAHGQQWLTEVQHADDTASKLAGSDAILAFASAWREGAGAARNTGETDEVTMIDFRGYAYTRNPSPISGAPVTVYDPKTPQIWYVPFHHQVKPSLTIKAPREYIVPAAEAKKIGARLALHGIRTEEIRSSRRAVPVEVFRAREIHFSNGPFEGRLRATYIGAWTMEKHDIPAGSLSVPVNQRLSRLILTLLEPQAPDSFAAWGFFNAFLEQKEYMEPYVAEHIARDMLKDNPALEVEFKQRLVSDAAFAADPRARLRFFLQRHSSWDERYNMYPIVRIA